MNNQYIYPLVSVVIPSYGRTTTLSRAIESLKKQKYTNIQLIIVDDNENNHEFSNEIKIIFNKYKSFFKNSKLISNNLNVGSARARNLGIEQCDGEYITFLDDDDWYLEDKISIQLEKMIKENTDVSYTQIKLVDEKGNCFREIKRKNIEKYYYDGKIMEYHFINHITATSTFMFKSKSLKLINGFELKDNDMGDEFYLTFKAIKNNLKMSFIDQILVYAEVHQKSGMSVDEKRLIGEKNLYNFKIQNTTNKSRKFLRFLKARYYLTLTVFWLKKGKIFKFIKCGFLCLFTAPFQIIKYIFISKN